MHAHGGSNSTAATLAAHPQHAVSAVRRDCLASCMAEARRARLAQLASLRPEVESRERDRAAALVGAASAH